MRSVANGKGAHHEVHFFRVGIVAIGGEGIRQVEDVFQFEGLGKAELVAQGIEFAHVGMHKRAVDAELEFVGVEHLQGQNAIDLAALEGLGEQVADHDLLLHVSAWKAEVDFCKLAVQRFQLNRGLVIL
jgi:uncharacterized protein involved in type VI secretion and phage assembly